MITDPRIDKPEDGFRFTHDVFHCDNPVGQATEVQLSSKENGFTWWAFVEFCASAEALVAINSNDVIETVNCWKPLSKPKDPEQHSIAAQYVALRGKNKRGSFELVLKKTPVPIPNIEPPNNEDDLASLAKWKPLVVAW
jgi:hypothetical protein